VELVDRCLLFCITGQKREFFEKGLLVALRSVRYTNPEIPVVIFFDELTGSQKEALSGCDLRRVDPQLFNADHRDDLTRATFFRFYIGRELGHVKRILYLDGDLVVLDRLDDVFDIDRPLVAALKMPSDPEGEFRDSGALAEKEQILTWHPIFNAGVLCFDGPYWQQHDLLGRALEIANYYGWDMFTNCDQGILNLLANTLDGYHQLHPRFNFWPALAPRARLIRNKHGLLTPVVKGRPSAVVHWAGPKKPWKVRSTLFHRVFPRLYRVTADACYFQFIR